MLQDLVKSVKSLLAEKNAVRQKEIQLIEHLNRVLPEIGYQIIPASRGRARRGEDGVAWKPLACPQCERRFSHPLHLGRHMSATHGKRKQAA